MPSDSNAVVIDDDKSFVGLLFHNLHSPERRVKKEGTRVKRVSTLIPFRDLKMRPNYSRLRLFRLVRTLLRPDVVWEKYVLSCKTRTRRLCPGDMTAVFTVNGPFDGHGETLSYF